MSKIGPFVLGGLLGAAIGVLYAPRTGDQTRALLAEKVGAVWGEAKDFGASVKADPQSAFQTAAAKGQEFAKVATDSASKALGAVSARATGQVDPAFSGTGDADELRAKIEAARQRIAAQVMANAQEASANAPVEAEAEEIAEQVAEVAEEAAEAVEEAAEEAE